MKTLHERFTAAMLANRNAEGLEEAMETSQAIHAILVEVDELERAFHQSIWFCWLDRETVRHSTEPDSWAHTMPELAKLLKVLK